MTMQRCTVYTEVVTSFGSIALSQPQNDLSFWRMAQDKHYRATANFPLVDPLPYMSCPVAHILVGMLVQSDGAGVARNSSCSL